MVVAKKTGKKVRKKQWFQIIAPQLFHEQVIGEIYLYDIGDAVGRNVYSNLTSLTRDIKRQNINIKFIINRVSDNRAFTDVIGYEMIPASVRRLVRRGKSKIEASFVAETADRKKVRIKPLLIARNIVKHSVSLKLRKVVEELITKNFKKSPYINLVQSIVIHKFQSNLKKSLNKIYPLRICEIRDMQIEKEAKAKGISEDIIKKEIEAKAIKEKEKEKAELRAEEKKEKAKPKKKKEKKKAEEAKKEEKPEEKKAEEKPEEVERKTEEKEEEKSEEER